MDFSGNFFNLPDPISIPDDVDVVVVSDMFVEDYVGGAELTTEALIEASPLNVFKLHSKDVNLKLLEQGVAKHWVFGNFSGMDFNLIPTIVANMSYSVLEYDYKYCRYRSREKHFAAEQQDCGCENEQQGKMISAFYYGAKSLWWMSEQQLDIYKNLFPFLSEKNNTVLSSVFDDKTFSTVKLLREKYKDVERKGWIVLGSPSWIKGMDEAKEWCEKNQKDYEVLWGLPYDQVLDKLAQAEGFVYLPQGGDTCPRMVIEAKLLGCELHLNDFVQHAKEIWFDTDDLFDTEAYLYAARTTFWNGIKHAIEYAPSISGYTTTKDCISQGYPYEQSIQSLLGFCDEVVVVDGGSEDGTWERLQELAKDDERLVIHQQKRDWNHPRFAVFDGMQKAAARAMCSGDFCWQQDSDEIVHEDDYAKIKNVVKNAPKQLELVALPVIEYWGGEKKVRFDINPWKWRLSRNLPHITHGIPADLRQYDENGELYAKEGTDGCDYVRSDNFDRIPFMTFYTADVHNFRVAALQGDEAARKTYEAWFNAMIKDLPCVFHFSWWDLERKIKTYRDYWGKHWKSLYDIEIVDTAENNMMFDMPWSEVTDDMVVERAKLMDEKLGGWVWHAKWDGVQETKHIKSTRDIPESMNAWTQN